MSLMPIAKDEQVIATYGPFTATSHRVVYWAKGAGQNTYTSMPLSQVQWVGIERTSQPLLVLLSVLCAVGALLASAVDSNSTTVGLAILGLLFIGAYFFGQQLQLRISSGSHCAAHRLGGSSAAWDEAFAFIQRVESLATVARRF